MRLKLLFIVLGMAVLSGLNAQIVINEVCVDNEAVLADFEGDFPDWIELYNPVDSAIELHTYYLSDKSNDLFKWNLPSVTIPPNGFLIVFASGKNTTHDGEIHASFKLEEGTEGCYLSTILVPMVSFIAPHPLPSDMSRGQLPDGFGEQVTFYEASPGRSNNESTPAFFADPTPVHFSHPAGFYLEDLLLELYVERTGVEIRYTLDGTPVNASSAVYTSPIVIRPNSKYNDGLSFIPTSDTWQEPEEGVRRITVIRAAAFEHGFQVGEEITQSYFIGSDLDSYHRAPLVSLSTDISGFFSDSSGIYVHGNSTYGNFTERGIKSERRISANFFAPEGEVIGSQILGARIHGRSSRYAPQKSIRLHARDRYGCDTLMLPGIRPGIAHNELILRAPESLFSTSLFTDELVQTIVSDLDLDLQKQLPAIVFLNGEYWGLHHIREHLGAEYLHSLYGIDEEQIDILDWDNGLEILDGDDQAYRALESFLLSNDFSNAENYQALSEKVDISSFTDYIIAQLFFANEDFGVNNVRFWKEKSDSSRWRFFFFDADATMREHWQDRLGEFLQGKRTGDPVTLLFTSLLENENYRQYFFGTYVNYLTTIFNPQHLLDQIHAFETLHAPLVSEHIARWNRPGSYAEWQNALDNLETFAIMRPPLVLQTLNQYFENPFTVYPNPCANETALSFFRLTEGVTPEVTLTDQAGRIVPFQLQVSGSQYNIDLSNLENGIYLIRVDMGTMNYASKIVKTSL